MTTQVGYAHARQIEHSKDTHLKYMRIIDYHYTPTKLFKQEEGGTWGPLPSFSLSGSGHRGVTSSRCCSAASLQTQSEGAGDPGQQR